MQKSDIIGKYFPVLDNYGFISLVDYMGGDEDIEQAARLSYQKGTRKLSDTRNLLRYLMRHKHTSPTEFVQLKFHISMPIFVHRQLVRHRASSMNEASGRYSVLPTYTYFPSKDNFCLQSSTNKQGRSDIVSEQEYTNHKMGAVLQNSLAKQSYQNMLNDNVARELARINLPLSIYTEFYWSINLHNLFHFMKLRCDSHAQYEIRQYANIMAGIIKLTHPLSFEAWYDYSHKSFNWTRLDQILFNKTRHITDEENDYEKSVYSIGESIGMSKREIEEYFMKIRMPQDDDFSLDLSTAKTAEHYHNIRNEVTNGETREVQNQTCGETT